MEDLGADRVLAESIPALLIDSEAMVFSPEGIHLW
jgi:hypothetical protein